MTDDIECPKCGAEDSFQELAYRYTWQPVRLNPVTLEAEDWQSFDYGDDVFTVGVNCVECMTCWPTYADLKSAILGLPHKTGEAPITITPEP